jgi:CHAT domain-containing protein
MYRNLGQYDRSRSIAASAVDILAKHLAHASAERSGVEPVERRKYRICFENYAEIAFMAGHNVPEQRPFLAAEIFRTIQLAHASGTARAISSMAARFGAREGTLATVIRSRQDLADRWQRIDSEITKSAGYLQAERNRVEEAARLVSLDHISRQLEETDAHIALEFPSYAELINPKPMTAGAVSQLLAPEEALLVYLVTEQATWLYLIRHNGSAFETHGIGAEALATEVTALRARLDPESNPDLLNPDPPAFTARRAYALYEKILAPAAPLLDGADHLIIVLDGALQSLPFGVLVTRRPERDPENEVDHRDIAWLARDYAITVLPSVSSLGSLRQHAAVSKATRPFFGVGDPVLRGRPGQECGVRLASLFRGNLADVEKVRELRPLPDTARELRAIARVMGAADDDLLLRQRACEPMVRQAALDQYKAIGFATHGLVSGELEGLAEAALVLTPPDEATPENDGLLTASKIATLKLDADWVVLSACNTAAGDGTPDADGLTGLAKAFFYAGARSLLVSHWPVWSPATVALTTGAFTALAQDPSIGRAAALQRSMMAMLDPSSPPKFAHPFAWAPFVLAGEGGAGLRS